METSLSPNEKLRRVAPMRPWPLPKGMTRDQFNDLVAHLNHRLAANGLDPSSHLSVGDFDEIIDGKIHHRFALFISDTVVQILERKSD
jgi:hypothetical protein